MGCSRGASFCRAALGFSPRWISHSSFQHISLACLHLSERQLCLPAYQLAPLCWVLICELDECVLRCLLRDSDKNTEQDRPQARTPQYSTPYSPESWTPLLHGQCSHGCLPLSQPRQLCPVSEQQMLASIALYVQASPSTSSTKFSLTPSVILAACVSCHEALSADIRESWKLYNENFQSHLLNY